MLTKHVEGTLSQTEAKDLLTRVNALEDALPFLIDLNLDERKAMVGGTLGDLLGFEAPVPV